MVVTCENLTSRPLSERFILVLCVLHTRGAQQFLVWQRSVVEWGAHWSFVESALNKILSLEWIIEFNMDSGSSFLARPNNHQAGREALGCVLRLDQYPRKAGTAIRTTEFCLFYICLDDLFPFPHIYPKGNENPSIMKEITIFFQVKKWLLKKCWQAIYSSTFHTDRRYT